MSGRKKAGSTARTPGAKKGAAKGNEGKVPVARLDLVREAIASCWSHSKIEAKFSEEWKLSTRTIRNYINRVYEDMRVDDETYRAGRRDRLRAAIERHYQKCMVANEVREAGLSLDRLAKVDGLNTERLELTGKAGGPIAVATSANLGALAGADQAHLEWLASIVLVEDEAPMPPTALKP